MSWAGCISQTDQAGHTTRYEYDTLGRLYKVTDPMGHASYFGYDALGEKTSQTDANGHVTYFSYDNRGRLVTKTLPLGQSDNRTYDTLGRLSTMTDFNGKVTTFVYDLPTGRLMSKTASVNGTPTGEGVSFTYNLLDGSRKSAARTMPGGTSVTTTYAYYGYDAGGNPTPDFRQGQLKSVTTQTGTGPLLTISYNYDLLGNKIAMQTPSSKVIGYGYDILNRLSTVTHPDNAVTTFGYDKVGNRQSVLRATSATASPFSTTGYTYDTLNRLTDIINKNGSSTVVSSYHYGLRLDGKRGSVIETGPATSNSTTNYTYDDQGKLIEEAGPYADIKYGYDNVGNRLIRTVTNAAPGNGTTLVNGTTTNTYDQNDRIATVNGSATHSYDLDGNETTVNGQAAGYDFENHLVSLGSSASYVYDADGNRTSVSSAGATTNYVVDTSLPYASVVEEYNGTAPAARYDYGDDLVRMDRASGVSYYLYDGLGSTRQLISTSGAVTDSYGYSAFGEMASHTGSTVNPFLFNAQQLDGASGDYFLRARYYDQSNGRFLSQDPSEGDNQDPATLHRYLYAHEDAINRVDPGGRADNLVGLSVGLGIAGGILGGLSDYAATGKVHASSVITGIAIGAALPWIVSSASASVIAPAVPWILGGLTTLGIGSSILLVTEVISDPNASTSRKVAALAVLVGSIALPARGSRTSQSRIFENASEEESLLDDPEGTGVGPGRFEKPDVALGFYKRGSGFDEFVGNAYRGTDFPNDDPYNLDLFEGSIKPGIAKAVADGGTIRFMLDGFDENEALTPGSKYYNEMTSKEYRYVRQYHPDKTVFYRGNNITPPLK